MPGVPGVATQVPKRDEERRRRNKPEVPLNKYGIEHKVEPPPMPEGLLTQIARDFYESLINSGQSHWYEDSDWIMAQYAALLMDETILNGFSATKVQQLNGLFDKLLASEASRRRARIEIERPSDTATSKDEDAPPSIDRFRALRGG